MKGIEALEILYVTAKLRDGAMCDEMLAICVAAKLWDTVVQADELETR